MYYVPPQVTLFTLGLENSLASGKTRDYSGAHGQRSNWPVVDMGHRFWKASAVAPVQKSADGILQLEKEEEALPRNASSSRAGDGRRSIHQHITCLQTYLGILLGKTGRRALIKRKYRLYDQKVRCGL